MDPSELAPTDRRQALRRRVGVAVGALAIVGVLLIALRPGPGSGAAQPATSTTTSVAAADPTTGESPSAAQSSTSSTSSSPTLPDYESTGEFETAKGSDRVRGSSGQLMTYEVEVEKGSGVSARVFAGAIDGTLRNPRGWTAGGHWRFQRVSAGQSDLTIRLATPKSVDAQCAAAGLNTHGYTSCRTGRYILINLDRWYLGVPQIRDLDLYRNYLINHEVGHALGKGHQSCPGKGETAPVMLQQTLGLDGCVANAWPRDTKGKLVTGPPTD
ncbi:DUF3152 domain-containing protein [Janibacter alittae]|uniref:DUF3152 domain-containing protein n=1 Tax=Janibacter alittae TaxID=3115209 RepID=A0ABZ2MIM6_9MICO